ncbi:uncharacterized protein BT62DRAFT_917789 [Guyanagaster necrorhizus]|uniref:Uncharacterized protein n=1 Tax=Guyanagaster necrorhizus TaxID=856835 RepID=A0A9P8AVC7_9AGAR|nr:uncharacterized protein BT62DRAFT_917789 [Guyanagaster necrorhizus MCA 3950]KAG7449165.1 hypothetical protein BT62DRAFT_917789 [Guyanagaster necrorhizus MCA 3950]
MGISYESNFFFIKAHLLIPPPIVDLSNKCMQDTGRAIEASASKHLHRDSSATIAERDQSTFKLSTSCPCKIMEKMAKEVHTCSSLEKPISKSFREIQLRDLKPMDLLVPDQDFGAFVRCKGTYFKQELADKIGYFISKACDAYERANPIFISELSVVTKI